MSKKRRRQKTYPWGPKAQLPCAYDLIASELTDAENKKVQKHLQGLTNDVRRFVPRRQTSDSAPDLPPSVTLVKAMGADKKVADGTIRLILPDRLGRVSIVGADSIQPLIEAFDSLR